MKKEGLKFLGRPLKKAEEGDGFEVIAHGFVVEVWRLDSDQWKATLGFEGTNNSRNGHFIEVTSPNPRLSLSKLEVAARSFQQNLQRFLGPPLVSVVAS